MYGAKAERHLFLFEKGLLIAKKSEDSILACKHCIEVMSIPIPSNNCSTEYLVSRRI